MTALVAYVVGGFILLFLGGEAIHQKERADRIKQERDLLAANLITSHELYKEASESRYELARDVEALIGQVIELEERLDHQPKNLELFDVVDLSDLDDAVTPGDITWSKS